MGTNMASGAGKRSLLRDKRAQGIAAMGLVSRDGDRFKVSSPTLRGRKVYYEVWRDESGKVRCSCPEFEEFSAKESTFRCEHILAVKHALMLKNSEAVIEQQEPRPSSEEVEVTLPYTNENASEEHFGKVTLQGVTSTESFEREQTGVRERAIISTKLRSLANHEDLQEHEMSNKQESSTMAPFPEFEADMPDIGEGHLSPVVPIGFSTTLRSLKQQVDPSQIRTREGWTDRQGNTHMVEYVEWHTVADILDRIAPTWSHSVRSIQLIGDIVAVVASITIDGVTREGVGTGTAESEMGIKKAEHDALKRAAVKFGIARELYQRESEVIERQGTVPPAEQFPRDPLAKSMADLVTPKQLGMIRALAREAGIDADEESMSVLQCRTEELSKRAASSFIDHLKGLQKESAGGMRRAS
jgi:hypothetical protein